MTSTMALPTAVSWKRGADEVALDMRNSLPNGDFQIGKGHVIEQNMSGQKQKNSPDIKKSAVRAALSLAAKQGWGGVGMAAVAEAAQVSLEDLYDHFDNRDDILRQYGRMLDRQVIAAFEGEIDEAASPKDRLFDILMERFDLLNDDREAVLAIMDYYRYDPKKAAFALPHLARSMGWMLDLAGLSEDGWRGALKVLGLSAVYLDTAFRVWSRDDSPDLAKTMAALDRALGRVESAAGTLRL